MKTLFLIFLIGLSLTSCREIPMESKDSADSQVSNVITLMEEETLSSSISMVTETQTLTTNEETDVVHIASVDPWRYYVEKDGVIWSSIPDETSDLIGFGWTVVAPYRVFYLLNRTLELDFVNQPDTVFAVYFATTAFYQQLDIKDVLYGCTMEEIWNHPLYLEAMEQNYSWEGIDVQTALEQYHLVCEMQENNTKEERYACYQQFRHTLFSNFYRKFEDAGITVIPLYHDSMDFQHGNLTNPTAILLCTAKHIEIDIPQIMSGYEVEVSIANYFADQDDYYPK